MKHILYLLCILCGSSSAAAPPSIIVILTDDHGWADLGASGVDPHIRTPNLDQLAADGVRFTRGYVTAPQCTPSRAGLISGRYQNRFGVEQNFDPMRGEVVTLPERLKESGYTTGMHLDTVRTKDAGKGNDPLLAPRHQGFDEYFTGTMQDYTASHGLDGELLPDAPGTLTAKGCRVTLQTEWALRFLKRRYQETKNQEPGTQHSAKPFFLYLAYMAPHTPLEFPKPWIDQVPKDLPRERRSALALLAAIDDGVGRLVISLDIAATALAAVGQPAAPELDGINLLPHLTGENNAPPHETLYWRWADQAAIVEFPFKLILLGRGKPLLFDITQPEGEHHTRELGARHPEIAKRLQTKLGAWMSTLNRPGPLGRLVRVGHFTGTGILLGKAAAELE